MAKSTIQVVLEAKDLDFLAKLIENHHLKNNSEAVRTMISRYKGMEDWILARRQVEETAKNIKKAKISIY
jgi:Arc/MetJ-type ribon-helix-helix transcriptional regulator